MASFTVEHVVTVADVNGNQASVRFRVRQIDTTTLATLKTTSDAFKAAVAGCSNGKIIQASVHGLLFEDQIVPGSTPPTNAVYPTVTDGARLNMSNADGAQGHVTVPAPTAATFQAAPHSDFVDPSGDASGLIAFLKTNYSDLGGVFLNFYDGGIKVGRRARKRRSPRPGL